MAGKKVKVLLAGTRKGLSLERVPGGTMSTGLLPPNQRILEHYIKALVQHFDEPLIGKRGTPAISIWPMRPKWEKRPEFWEQVGTDGDVEVGPTITEPVYPDILQFAYIKTSDNRVIQLAYRKAKGSYESYREYERQSFSLVR